MFILPLFLAFWGRNVDSLHFHVMTNMTVCGIAVEFLWGNLHVLVLFRVLPGVKINSKPAMHALHLVHFIHSLIGNNYACVKTTHVLESRLGTD